MFTNGFHFHFLVTRTGNLLVTFTWLKRKEYLISFIALRMSCLMKNVFCELLDVRVFTDQVRQPPQLDFLETVRVDRVDVGPGGVSVKVSEPNENLIPSKIRRIVTCLHP